MAFSSCPRLVLTRTCQIGEMPKIYVTSPVESDVYLPGDSLTAEWALDPSFAKMGIRGYVGITSLGPDGKWTSIVHPRFPRTLSPALT